MGVEVRGGLQVSFVEKLGDVIEPVVAYLNNPPVGRDLFDVDHIIVPNAGVRAWLLQHIANSVGVTSGKTDGIAAQVDIKYLGALDGFLGRGFGDSDPWEVGPLAISVLNVLQSVTDAEIKKNVERLGGGLKAARAIADKFDQYHARRPSMILEWMNSGPNLAPTLADDFRDGQYIAQRLADSDKWQYDLWKLVHASIGQDPWAAVVQSFIENPETFNASGLPPRLLIAGVQSLSARHIRILQLLAKHIEVSMFMVHPSPALAERWNDPASGNVPAQIIAPLTPARVEFDDSIDPMVGMWLRGAHDAQQLLASQGASANLLPATDSITPTTLLQALQHSVRTGNAVRITHNETDPSVQMHRAHNLGRQIEILHESLIHAFNDIKGLEPHDVVVVCADIESAAPLLEATFGRTVKSANGDYTLPLVVADRGLRFVDEGASLLSSILTAVRGRFSITDVMSVATSPLVLQNFNANGDDIEAWNRIIERTRIRWGANQHHRARMNVDIHEDAHTWSAGIRRALAGALLPDSSMQADFGDVVPLADIEAVDIDTVATLSRIITVLTTLEEKKNSGVALSITEWADAVEDALTSLGADSRDQLSNAREVINKLRGYVTAAAGDGAHTAASSFADFADLLEELVSGTPGRQPLRTGAITATSMVPLRSVPFKVVCLVGFDEGTMRAGEAEGDDLVSRQDFVGDSNARIDQRRAILDAFVAAESRFIITCNGRSIKDNTEVPLITPLSELLDLCERCGVQKKEHDGNHLKIEHQHPRHFGSARNYERDAIVPGVAWSHDEVGLAALSETKSLTEAQQRAEEVEKNLKKKHTVATDEIIITPKDFLRFIGDPLKTFVQFGLKISTWNDESEDEPALVPLTSRKDEQVVLCRTYIDALDNGFTFDQWKKTQVHIGALPFWAYGDEQASRVKEYGDSYVDRRAAWGIALKPTTLSVDVPFPGGRVTGELTVYLTDNNCIAIHEYQAGSFGAPSQKQMAHSLLLLLASGQHFDGGHILYRRSKDRDTFLQHVELDPDISTSDAIDTVRALADLFVRATRNSYPLFGDAAEEIVAGDRIKALKAFRSRMSFERGNADGDKFPFVSSHECLVYGLLPQFDDVYTKEVINFFELYFSLMLEPDKDRAAATGDKNIAPPHGGPKRTQRNVYA